MSLALDLMEEFRSIIVDRMVLSAINRLEISKSEFTKREDGAVMLNESGRRKIITIWQSRKQDELTHPYLKEKIAWGLAPYSQALLLARSIRGDIDNYPPFFYRI